MWKSANNGWVNACGSGTGCQLTQKQSFGVSGIYDCCGHWPGVVEKAIYEVPGVFKVRTNEVTKIVTVEHNTQTTLADIKHAVVNVGFTPVDMEDIDEEVIEMENLDMGVEKKM